MNPRIGFKMHVSNHADGWRARYLAPLIAAGVPPVVMTLDNAGPIFEAQVAMEAAGWPLEKRQQAALVFRLTPNDIPDYQADPRAAAEKQWAWHASRWPRELDKRLVWFGIVNEPAYILTDHDLPNGGGPYRARVEHNGLMVWDNAEWLAAHAYRLCELAVKDGYRFTALGWSPGTPEPWQWLGPQMAKLLDLLRQYPDKLGIDLHEGSMTTEHLNNPWLIGRWCNIPEPWPSIFVTEFGWTLNDAPPVDVGWPMLADAYRKWYAPDIPIALWTLGKENPAWGNVGQTINAYFEPVTAAMIAAGAPEPPPVVEPPPANDKPVLVLDVSKWQGTLNTDKMKAAGVDGVMVRASYAGTQGSKADERVDTFVPQLKAAGIPFGLYHYFHPARPVAEQFAAFKAVADRHGYSMRLALDLEEQTAFDSSVAARADDFLFMMDEAFPLPAGKAHMVYTSLGYWRQMGQPAFGDYDLWIAAWTSADRPAVPSAWDTWRLWQYTSDGDGPAYGVGSARLDMNRFNGTRAEFNAWLVDGTPAPEPLPAALWADATNRRVWDWNPAHALAKRILADGLIPAGYELRFEHDGRVYYYQIALNGARTVRRVYYAENGKWGNVQWIDGPGGVEPPPPPQAATIDLLPYIRGDGRAYMVQHPSGASEKFRTVTEPNSRFKQVKNSQWEGFYYTPDFIWRDVDTSPGDGQYYRQFEDNAQGARWCPRFMAVGQTWIAPVPHTVQTYDKADCRPVEHHRNGTATNRLTLVARHERKTWGGVTVEDVIEVVSSTGETMYFGRGYGLVAWSSAWGSSAISHVLPPHEADNRPETGCFS